MSLDEVVVNFPKSKKDSAANANSLCQEVLHNECASINNAFFFFQKQPVKHWNNVVSNAAGLRINAELGDCLLTKLASLAC